MTSRSLVTGGAGFIGAHLVRLLRESGESVRVLDLTPAGTDETAMAGVEWVQGSILDAAVVRDAMAGVTRVFHLAADPNLWARDKNHFTAVNLDGTRQVLEAAADAGVRKFVYTSTESIIKGTRRSDGVVTEEFAVTVDDMPGPYCRSKFLAEQEARAFAERGLPVVIVNPTLPVGPGDGRVTPPTRMLLDFLNGKNPAYLDFHMNVIDVRDAAMGHLLAAERGRVGERYILGGENLSLTAVLALLGDLTGLEMPSRRVPYAVAWCAAVVSEALAKVTGEPPKAPLTGVRLARTRMEFDSTKTRGELGLVPRPAREALRSAIADFAARGLISRTMPKFEVP